MWPLKRYEIGLYELRWNDVKNIFISKKKNQVVEQCILKFNFCGKKSYNYPWLSKFLFISEFRQQELKFGQ